MSLSPCVAVKKCHQFVFNDFILRNDGVLMSKNTEIHVPPKELEVLIMLLSAGGKIVSKEDIFNKVWNQNAASDESLTRCIYALRRILSEDKKNRYIETIYSKGYRFRCQVAIVSEEEQSSSVTSIAIFPFPTQSFYDESILHHKLVHGLSRYSCFGLNIFPASVTQQCHDFVSINDFIRQVNPDYYLTGKIVSHSQSNKLFIEFVRASDHLLIEHQTIDFVNDIALSSLIPKIVNVIISKVPGFMLNEHNLPSTNSLDATLTCLNGRRELYKFTPESLENALSFLLECISLHPQYSQPYCYLAECYLSLALLGLHHHQQAIDNAVKAIDTAIELDPGSAQALSLLGLINSIKNHNAVADVLFQQAHLLTPVSPDIYYYQALNAYFKGNMTVANNYINKCLALDPGKISACVLKLWLKFYTTSAEQALVLAQNITSSTGITNPLIRVQIALFSALKGDFDIARKHLEAINAADIKGDVAVNNMYITHLIYGKQVQKEVIEFVKYADYDKLKGNILPLIEVAYGNREMKKHFAILKSQNNLWSNIWPADPRLVLIPAKNKKSAVAA